MHRPIKLFVLDLNWSRRDCPYPVIYPSAAHEWAHVDPREYFDYHIAFGNNAIFCHAFTFGGYAFYPSRLGPVAPGPGQQLLPRLYELTRQAGLPFWSYFCVGTDVTLSAQRNDWVIPNSRMGGMGFLGPETEWTDLLCARLKEFLVQFPVDWILFDWFFYGSWVPRFRVQPATFAAAPFQEIIGRPMPERAEEITTEESLKYKREVLTRQFRRIRDTVRQTSPATRIMFNVPYLEAREPLWVDHQMLSESDGLFAESTKPEILEWLLSIRQPHQRVMTTIIGQLEKGLCDPESWRTWHQKGCDFMGYAFCTPPVLKPHPYYEDGLRIVREGFRRMA
jgi:hypothetical protein